MLSNEPRQNTLAQRSWLYQDDPAVDYKIHGRPIGPSTTELSITLPSEKMEDLKLPRQQSWDHGRKFVMTGDVLTKTGAKRYGVFLDDHDKELFDQTERNPIKDLLR